MLMLTGMASWTRWMMLLAHLAVPHMSRWVVLSIPRAWGFAALNPHVRVQHKHASICTMHQLTIHLVHAQCLVNGRWLPSCCAYVRAGLGKRAHDLVHVGCLLSGFTAASARTCCADSEPLKWVQGPIPGYRPVAFVQQVPRSFCYHQR